ncbi:hypothetical protein F3Y22_tig00110556pilonHSYRG00528 [Hibiscus syriacus]|uniref:Uncharacterized protein n=1 Tax=Hibiscus syriacus TaxID=106335 RepID=A0A6A3A9R5_HIBSY|nr:hypothetical protein F3Y22_tig00110556pilonHSYRG00528 [Hibiscus syriacus]
MLLVVFNTRPFEVQKRNHFVAGYIESFVFLNGFGVGGAFGGNRGLRPVPPEKGIFPLDHLHECDSEKKEYLNYLKTSGHKSEKCRPCSKKYPQCRMEREPYFSLVATFFTYNLRVLVQFDELQYAVPVPVSAKYKFVKIFPYYSSIIVDEISCQRHIGEMTRISPIVLPYQWTRRNLDFRSRRRWKLLSEMNYHKIDGFDAPFANHLDFFPSSERTGYDLDTKTAQFKCITLFNVPPKGARESFHSKYEQFTWITVCWLHFFKGYISKCILVSAFFPPCDPSDTGSEAVLHEADSPAIEFNLVNCLVWVSHEAARSFSLAVESLELDGSCAEIAMAWNGKDVHQWHKCIAHRVNHMLQNFSVLFDACALNNTDTFVAVYAMLKTIIEVEILLSQESHNNPSPVRKIFTTETGSLEEFIESRLKLRHPELVQWFRVVELPRMTGFFIPLLKKWSMEHAGSNCVLNISPESCPLSKISVGDVIVELMDLSHGIISVNKLHKLATEAGFEAHFLLHFGAKVRSSKKSDEIEFWIGLAQRKLSVTFTIQTMIPGKSAFNSKVQADSLATLGLFAYLGRKTRLFFSRLRINDLNELVKDFLTYLECGSLFIYTEFSSMSLYQFFMEPLGSAPLYSQLLAFLLQSQRLLSLCLEDYWAAYDRLGELLKITDSGASKHGPSTGAPAQPGFQWHLKKKKMVKSYMAHFCSASKDTDVWLGTQLLFVDLTVSLELLAKQLRGQKVTAREKRKLKRTLNDIATLIPVPILMLLAVSAVGHAAMLATINKYIPSLIPSPYTSERLDVAEQLKSTKKMEVTSWSNLEDSTS